MQTGTVKGTGVVAKKTLPKGLCIPYGGIYRTAQDLKSLSKHCNDRDRHLASYVASVRCRNVEGKLEWGILDAHPRVMRERKIPTGAWPGGFCNQADTPEEQNAKLIQHDGKCTAPAYEWMDEQCQLFVKLERPVYAGKEVLIDYAYSSSKQTRLGFGFKARRPNVESDYEFRPRNKTRKYGEMQIVG